MDRTSRKAVSIPADIRAAIAAALAEAEEPAGGA
jgi:hypothetical protein